MDIKNTSLGLSITNFNISKATLSEFHDKFKYGVGRRGRGHEKF